MMLSHSRSAQPAYATWSSVAKGANITLSNGDLTATVGVTTGNGIVTTGGPYLSNADRYWEAIAGTTANGVRIGMSTAGENLASQLGLSPESFGMTNAGSFISGGSTTSGTGCTFVAGNIVTVRYQGALLKVTYYVNGVLKYVVTLPYAVAGAPAASLSASFIDKPTVTASLGSAPPTYPISGSTWGWQK